MLLSINADSKTIKGVDKGYLTGILYLAPYNLVDLSKDELDSSLSGIIKIDGLNKVNLCPWATNGCKLVCLYTAGRGAFNTVQQARVNKTKKFLTNTGEFLRELINSIEFLVRKSGKLGLTPTVRLNGTSDINWQIIKIEGRTLFEIFPDVQFYDYTKNIKSVSNFKNYDLTYSGSPENKKLLSNTVNTALVFKGVVPNKYKGVKVIDGDSSDLRFLDQKNVIVGLTAKGKARKTDSIFVIVD